MSTVSTVDLASRYLVLSTFAYAVASTSIATATQPAEGSKSRALFGDAHASTSDSGIPTEFSGSALLTSYPYARFNNGVDRQTTEQERTVAEIRRWAQLGANWDGQNAQPPQSRSLTEATSFVRALPREAEMPEPMLHSTGRAGLFWRDENLYADLEFMGDGRVAYYLERGADKHKGVATFDGQKIPPVFRALLNIVEPQAL